jgi:hypothetical protein
MKYDVMTPIENPNDGSGTAATRGKRRTRWHRIGRAWSDPKGDKITIILDSVPFRSEYIYLFKSTDQTPSRDPEDPQHPEPGSAQG